MHPRNVLRTAPDFTKLAIKHKDFRQVCQLVSCKWGKFLKRFLIFLLFIYRS